MMINIAAIASGSNGNCYFFENDDDAILVDAGISCREIVRRIESLGKNMHKIRGIFITHEHSDHISGVERLSKKYNLPVFITKKTYEHSGLNLDEDLVNFIELGRDVLIRDIRITPFPKFHDAIEPCSFAIYSEDKKVSVITDCGFACENVIAHLKDSHAVFLESNYDDMMIDEGMYPEHLKARVKGDEGHLSNYQAALLILEHAGPQMQHVFLSHLSGNNNDPAVALKTFSAFLNQREDLSLTPVVTDRKNATDIYSL